MMKTCQVRLFFRAARSWGSPANNITRTHVYPSSHSANAPMTSRSLVMCNRSFPPLEISSVSAMSASHARSPSVASSLLLPKSCCACVSRGKSKKSGKKKGYQQQKEESDSDSDDIEEVMELKTGADFKEIKVKVASLRMDALLKAGLNMSRNKVDAAFYASKIRVNGEKILKKSHQCHEGDEIDLIKGVSRQNPNNLHVSRVVVLSLADMDEDDDKVAIKLRRYPHLLIECYEDYTPPDEE